MLWIGWYSTHQTINTHTQQKNQEIHSFMLAFFFCPIYAYFLRITLSSSLPFVTYIWGALLALPHYRACLRFNREKIKMFRIKFPSLASPCVEPVCIHATYQYSTQHAGCETLSAVSLYADAFVSGLDLDPNEHTRHIF